MDRDSSHGRKPAAAKGKELSLSPGDVAAAAAAAASVRRLSLSSEVFSEVEG